MSSTGILYLVATPIGNLEDITLRALRILREVDIVAAEDTRQTIKLLNHFDIKKPLISYHEHNKAEKGNYLVQQLIEGKSIALVTDAGTPGISDPGEDLVRLTIENGITATMIPGPVALISGLILSGLSTGRFVFEGYLPINKRSREERLLSLQKETRTLVFYEAPHKLIRTLKDIYGVYGNRRIALARELTKKFEELVRCTIEEAIKRYENESPRGEFVLIVEGVDEKVIAENKRKSWDNLSFEEHLSLQMGNGLNKKEAMKKVAEERGLKKRDVYNSLIKK